MENPFLRFSPRLIAALSFAALIAPAAAHHPGSHAVRQADGRVKLDIVAMASDSCTSIAAVERGTPPGIRAPQKSEPVIARLARPAGAVCATVVTSTRSEAVFAFKTDVQHVHVYVLAPDGAVQASERVPIR